MTSNDYLILAGTLHSVFVIANQLTPKALQISNNDKSFSTNVNDLVPYIQGIGISQDNNKSSSKELGSYLGPDYFNESFVNWNKGGLKQLVTDDFSLFIYQTLTGIKFVLVSTQQTTNNISIQVAENILRKVYCIYTDYVMKNPFYSLEMPIKCELFDKKLQELVKNC